MKVNEISVTKSFTRNLGNFESTRVEYGLSATPDDGESADEVREKLAGRVEKWIEEDILEIDEDAGR